MSSSNVSQNSYQIFSIVRNSMTNIMQVYEEPRSKVKMKCRGICERHGKTHLNDFALVQRNESEDCFNNFAEHPFVILNNFFHPRRLYTWISPLDNQEYETRFTSY